ncbi:hypothetical protein [Clostridium sp. UBA4548]|uniref:hypothetical protein n=1 Tax=Clostridium sp. UBA4548 TaxID=1946361 RepID=UPI0025C4AED6|nr:hypothetical protein [Clostridium sp. UBA4548]
MNLKLKLKLIFITILSLSFGLYFIFQGVMCYKKKVIIQHYSAREISYFFISINFLIQTTFIDNNMVELEWIAMGVIPIIILVAYIIYSRVSDIKYGIYNIDKETYKEILKNTLNENSIQFSFDGSDIRISKTPSYIEFIDKGIIIAEYKCITNYKHFLTSLQRNLKEAKYEKKTRDWISNILLGIFLISIPIILLLITIF